MKKILASIVAASFLTIGTAYCEEVKRPEPSKYEECLKKYENLVPGEIGLGGDYVAGEFLLGFDKDITKEEANKFIESYDKNNELELKEHNTIYTLVKVLKGKEIEYICLFQSMKDETIVKYSEPNYVIRLPFPINNK